MVRIRLTKNTLTKERGISSEPSHQGAAEWIDRAIELVKPHAKKICFRGDTDFSLTKNFDRWAEIIDFAFGMDACKGFKKRAEELAAGIQKHKTAERAGGGI